MTKDPRRILLLNSLFEPFLASLAASMLPDRPVDLRPVDYRHVSDALEAATIERAEAKRLRRRRRNLEALDS